ncbi:pilus assembly protein [Paraburkholderia acidicola]|uniref:Pilus assembly protein n=1 Tax=Paraburkholderia acidicola TaxID=1912599 RepID=A0ABV1LFS2_9BURK
MSASARPRTTSGASRRSGSPRRAQNGAAGIEFALVFPLFFVIFYGIITYSLIFIAQQSLTLATEEGARAALNYQVAGNVNAALTARATAACNTATNMVARMINNATCTTNLPAGGLSAAAALPACSFNGAMACISVTLTYRYSDRPLIPSIPLLNLVLPAQLTSTATVQLNPVNIL